MFYISIIERSFEFVKRFLASFQDKKKLSYETSPYRYHRSKVHELKNALITSERRSFPMKRRPYRYHRSKVRVLKSTRAKIITVV